jgi:hypothetical protein
MTMSTVTKLARILRFVEQHDPVINPHIDEDAEAVVWDIPAVHVETHEVELWRCTATTFAEAREELGY